MKIKSLQVHTPQGQAGHLDRESQYVFSYLREIPANREVSITMPYRARSYVANQLHPIFTMNRPEGWLAQALQQRMAKFGAMDDMSLLAITGQNQIGRLTYLQDEQALPSKRQPITKAEILQSPSAEVFSFLVDQYIDSGISGVQPKVLVPDAADSKATGVFPDLIVKSGGDEYPELALNEFLCMSAAKLAGIPVPDFWLSQDRQLFILQRFDLSSDGSRLGFEDMATLSGQDQDPYGNYKYQGSYEELARIIQYFSSHPQEDLAGFFAMVALSVMIRNGDAHRKNFGMLYTYPGSEVSLAPAYDLVSTQLYPLLNLRTGEEKIDRSMALKMAKSRSYPLQTDLLQFGRQTCNVYNPEQVLERLANGMQESLREYRTLCSAAFFSQISALWESGLEVARSPIATGPKTRNRHKPS